MKYRSNKDILLRILQQMVEEPQTKTNIMYTGRLSYSQLKAYLPYLLENKLIQLTDLKTNQGWSHAETYILTTKGHEALNHLKDLDKLLDVPMGLQTR